jgi:hypothetical protein
VGGQRYRGTLADAAADYRLATGQHLHKRGVISARSRPPGSQTARRLPPLVHFDYYKGRGARQVIANGDTVRSCDRNPLHENYGNALRAVYDLPANAIRMACAPRKLQSLIQRPISVKEITATRRINPMRASST